MFRQIRTPRYHSYHAHREHMNFALDEHKRQSTRHCHNFWCEQEQPSRLSSLGAMLIEHMPLQSQVPLLPANPEAEHMEIEMDESVANAAAKQRQLERAETIR